MSDNKSKIDKFRQDFDRESTMFVKMLPTLLATYRDQYVAILNGRVIGVDNDELSLVEQMQRKHPSEFVLVRKVTSNPPLPDYFDSPESFQ